jgi:ABC transport system ATP-binding/permease protein
LNGGCQINTEEDHVSAQDFAKLVIVEGTPVGQEYELKQEKTTIGRDASCDIVVSIAAVSRRHSGISRDSSQYYVEDLGSSNGTLVNGEKISQRRQLKDGDLVALGHATTFRFSAPPAEDATAIYSGDDTAVSDYAPTAIELPAQPPPAPKQPAAPPSKLVVTVAGQAPQAFDLTREQLTLGRSMDNDITINSRIVSRQHARLVRAGDGYQLQVLPQASNPVYYQDQPLAPGSTRQLRGGDQLRIGQQGSEGTVTLTYQAIEQDAATQIASPSARPEAPPRPAAPPAAAPPAGRPFDGMQTMIGGDYDLPPSASAPPQFQVAVAGNPPQNYTLTKEQVTIGRAPDNDIVIDSKIVSRHHARLERLRDGGYQLVPFPDAGNPVLFEGRPLTFSRRLQHADKLRIGGQDPGLMVTLSYLSPSEAGAAGQAQSVAFGEKTVITIGRDPENDVVLDIPVVSRYHAQIERVGQRYRARDLRSSNGTFVNDERIEGDVWLKPDDTVRIGPYRFVMGQDELAQYDETGGLRVEAAGLNKWVRKDLNILQNISVVFQPREFVVVVGQSGGGKSTLVDSIAGYRPATHGKVYVNDVDVYQNFDVIRNDIGYVPQRDIIHMELTVFQALDYSAQLRMPPDTTKAERHKRINEVMEDLDLAHRKDVQISGLSGGQQKRVSIGVELLTKPGLFFLDEPTSGLDPGTETSLMQLMRRLADQGRTIALVTHATKNVMLADKVVFLARGGYLAWFGPPDEALAYFDQYRSERDRRAREIEFDEIYAILDNPQLGKPAEWGERYLQHPAYQQYVVQPLQEVEPEVISGMAPAPKAPTAAAKPKRRRQVSSLRQFSILSSRNVKILTRDRFSLILMLAAAPLVSLLDVILSLVLGGNPFGFQEGFMANVLITMFLLTVYGVMVGGLAQMREIVKEQDVYKRERLVNLRILPYVMSKIWVALLLAAYQAAVYAIVHYLVFDMPGGWLEFLIIYISLALATMAGMMLGLFASALAPTANAAPMIVILLMLPQIVLGGALVPLPQAISAPTSTRWAFQAFMAATGTASDVAADACWQLPPAQRTELLNGSLEEKEAAGCRCMGTNVLREEMCNFPGNGQYYDPAIDEPPPVEPTGAPGDPPPEPEFGAAPPRPELPPQPEECADETDLICLSEYQNAFRAWQAEVEQINSAYEAEVEAYQAEVDIKTDPVPDRPAGLPAKCVRFSGGNGRLSGGTSHLGKQSSQSGRPGRTDYQHHGPRLRLAVCR